MITTSTLRTTLLYEVAKLREKVLLWMVWRLLPRSVAYWATVRVVTSDYPGNPGERTALDALRSWRHRR